MHDFCFTLPYGAFVFLGGSLGYFRKGSVMSLAGGVVAGSLLLLAAQLSLSAYHKGSNSWPAHILQTAVAVLLTLMMGQRYLQTGKIMPAATVASISAIMSVFYLYKIVSGGNYLPQKIGQS